MSANQKEEWGEVRDQAVASLKDDLAWQQGFLKRLYTLRKSLAEHGFSGTVLDTAIAGWEANDRAIQDCIEELEKLTCP